MALLLCNLQPYLVSRSHDNQLPFRILPNKLHFNSIPKVRVSLSYRSYECRRVLVLPLKSASINGYSIQDSSENIADVNKGKAVESKFIERLRRWISFVPSLLPGGSWWRFDDDVEERILAEPVTVTRALSRMWGLVSKDRWVIIAAFSALIFAAVSFSFDNIVHFVWILILFCSFKFSCK